MQSFQINIEQAILDDLKRRLQQTRWPDEIVNEDWAYGTNRSYLQELGAYWAEDFDWRKQPKAWILGKTMWTSISTMMIRMRCLMGTM